MNWPRMNYVVAVALLFAALGLCESLPAGTHLPIRLRSEVSSKRSKFGDPVHAVLLATVPSDEHPLLSAGLRITGTVREVANRRGQPARLRIVFDQIQRPEGSPVPLPAKLVSVDNARESVAADGTIQGLKPVHVKPSKKEDVLLAAMYAHPLALASLEAMRLVRREMEDPAIDYSRDVAMTLDLTASFEAAALTGPVLPNMGTLVAASKFADLVAVQPLRTEAGGRPSDQINLLFIGTRKDLDSAFLAAGWSIAVAGGVRSDLRTFLAMFEQRGYDAAPVSTLTLEGRPPDRVYEKQTNTFSKRHHVRIWLRPNPFDGKPVWLGAATHDIGIDFSAQTRHFTHRVEPNVDLERTGILNDLRFTGSIRMFSPVPLPLAQRTFENATGDHLTTDGQILVMIYGAPSQRAD